MTFATAMQLDLRHGLCLGVRLPARWSASCEAGFDELRPEERQRARALGERRRLGFVGGRIALRRAAQKLGVDCPAVAVGEGGAPVLPEGLAASISHKRELAIALVERSGAGSIGVDVEAVGKARAGVARRVLGIDELAAVERLPEAQRWPAVLERFSIKEAIYKALYPHLRRLVAFDEVAVWPAEGASVAVDLRLRPASAELRVEARSLRLGELLLSTARVQGT